MFRATFALMLAVIVVAGCGGAELARPRAPRPAGQPAVTAMPAGTYSSVSFQPAVTYTVPAGWVKKDDSGLYWSACTRPTTT